ncbi:MAG TPA: FkbM family methyltransferase [Anaerolineae bacterium]|nr:FkbM family methyltransferase [Anaerolineae bacterium]
MKIAGTSELLIKAFRYFSLPFHYPRHFIRIAILTLLNRSLVRELFRLHPHKAWYKGRGFKTIIDIGANTGSFAFAMRMIFPDAQIFAFEPIPDCYQQLVHNLSSYGNFKAFQTAIGSHSGTIGFHQSEFLESSSVLPMGKMHKEAFPYTSGSKIVQVPIARLSEFQNKMTIEPPTLLKIDVQGYEDHVISGAKNILKEIEWITMEVSYQPLYEGQMLFNEIFSLMASKGFIYQGSQDMLTSPLDGSILQSDALFKRKK